MRFLKYILIAAIALAALGFIAFKAFQVQIGERMFNRAVAAAMSGNVLEDLGPGMHVFVCGSGSPLPDPSGRAGPCLAVVAGTDAFIFDAGAGSSRQLSRMGFPSPLTRGVFLTHLHSDHIASLGEVYLSGWISATRTEPQKVYGPEGVEKTVAGFNMAYSEDAVFRTAHHGEDVAPSTGFGGVATTLTPGAGEVVYEANGVKITAFDVDHDPVEAAIGYRVDYKGRSIAISGDTVYSENLVANARDVDVLFHEVLNADMVGVMEEQFGKAGRANMAKIMFDIQDYHTTPVDAARAASDAGAGQLVFYHIVPQLPVKALHPYFLKGTKDAYGGKITISEDGMVFTLVEGSDKVKVTER